MAALRLISSSLLQRFVCLLVTCLFLLYILSFVMNYSCFTIGRRNMLEDELKPQTGIFSQNSLPNPQLSKSKVTTNFNLMEEKYGQKWSEMPEDSFLSPIDCTIEYANENKLQQDHPCVIFLIRSNYIRQPAPPYTPYNLEDPGWADPSDGQSEAILRILRNQTNGFFVDCGGYDGELLSNTLYMERSLNWSGLLIEADQRIFNQLITRNRKAHTSPVCLSTNPYPMQVVFNASIQTLSYIIEQDNNNNIPINAINENKSKYVPNINEDKENIYTIQCFPLYSLLLAINRTDIDYFSLDIEGAELKVLKTIPWQKVYIKTLTVEWNHVPEGEPAITFLMERNRYLKFGRISMGYSHDIVYTHERFFRDFEKFNK